MEDIKDPKDLKIKEQQAIIAMLMEYKVNFMGKVCEMRDIKEPCRNCGGLGIQLYNDASTWRHLPGMKPQTTKDVCEHCWGSGDRENTWPKREAPLHDLATRISYDFNLPSQFPCEAGGNQFPCEAYSTIDAEVVKEVLELGKEDSSI